MQRSRSLAGGLRQHRVDHFHHELLAGAGKLGNAIHLLLQLGHRAALGGDLAVIGEQRFHGYAQALRDGRQQRHRNPAPTGLVRVDGLLGRADQLGELGLRDVLFLAHTGDAAAQGDKEGAFVGADGHGVKAGK